MEKRQYDEARLYFVTQADELIKQNKFQEALKLAEDRLSKMPFDIDAMTFAIQAFIKMAMIDESRKLLEEVENYIKKISYIYLSSADAYKEKGLDQDAVLNYQKYFSINPTASNLKEIPDKIPLPAGKDNLVEETAESDNISPGPDFYTMTLADLYIKQGHAKMAAEILREVIIKEPGNIQAREKLEAMEALIKPESFPIDKVAINSLINTLTCWLNNLDRLNTYAK